MTHKAKCKYCGNNPTPHFLSWYFESMSVVSNRLMNWGLFKFFSRNFSAAAEFLNLQQVFLNILTALKAVRYNDDVENCKVPRARLLWEEAEKREVKMKEILLFGKPIDSYVCKNQKSKIKNQNLVFGGMPRPKAFDSSKTSLLDDKSEFKKIMQKAGLPVPFGGSVWNFGQAKRIFSKCKDLSLKSKVLSLVVKPRLGSRGRHSTTFVRTEEDLKQAFKIAKQLCFWVVVEEQLFGPVYRATVIDYKLEGVLRGDSPQLIGNGQNNIEELIRIKNSLPHPGVKDVVVDERIKEFVFRELNYKFQITNFKSNQHIQSLNLKQSDILNYIPDSGEVVYLSEKIGVNYGGSSAEEFEICHPDNKDLFVQASKVLGDPLLGFDFIIPDITRSYKEQKCGFLEANTLPFINLHLDPLYGQGRNLAGKVWDMVFR